MIGCYSESEKRRTAVNYELTETARALFMHFLPSLDPGGTPAYDESTETSSPVETAVRAMIVIILHPKRRHGENEEEAGRPVSRVDACY